MISERGGSKARHRLAPNQPGHLLIGLSDPRLRNVQRMSHQRRRLSHRLVLQHLHRRLQTKITIAGDYGRLLCPCLTGFQLPRCQPGPRPSCQAPSEMSGVTWLGLAGQRDRRTGWFSPEDVLGHSSAVGVIQGAGNLSRSHVLCESEAN